jgi:hypothetical protein
MHQFILIMKLLQIIFALAYIILTIILLCSNNIDIIGSHLLGIIAGLQLIVLIENLILIIKTKSIK